jgi:hypothetical protein
VKGIKSGEGTDVDAAAESTETGLSRRSYIIGGVGVLAGGAYLALSTRGVEANVSSVAVPTAYRERFGTVIDVVDAGADPTGSEPIDEVLTDAVGDDTLLVFPEGRYLMNRQLRKTGYENLGFYGPDATMVHGSVEALDGNMVVEGEFSGPARFFRLGVIYAPGKDLLFEGFTFDFTGSQTGLRAIEAYVTDGLEVRDITIEGQHDTGTFGPALFSVTTAGGEGTVERFAAPDGGAYSENTIGTINLGPTGILLDPHSAGTLRLVDCELGGFPDNGLYVSGDHGTVHVEGGTYKNSNVCSIRLKGRESSVRGATVIVDGALAGGSQRGIRLDAGSDLRVLDTTITVAGPVGDAIRILSEAETSTIDNCAITCLDEGGSARGIGITPDAGRVEVLNSTIEMHGSNYGVFVQGNNDADDATVLLKDTSITGPASGDSAREAVRVERANGRFENLTIDQPGPTYRRCTEVLADDCRFIGGTYESTHHPIINKGNRTLFYGLTARSFEGWQAMKLYAQGSNVVIADSVLYGGYIDRGVEDLVVNDTEIPPV